MAKTAYKMPKPKSVPKMSHSEHAKMGKMMSGCPECEAMKSRGKKKK